MSKARLIFSTGSLWLTDTAYSFELAAEAGFDGIEIMCDQRFTTRNPDYLLSLAERYQLPILAVHTPFSDDVPGWGKNSTELERVTSSVQLAEQIGAQVVVVHLPMKLWYRSFKVGRLLQGQYLAGGVFREIKEWIEQGTLKTMQAQTPVKIAIENMPISEFLGRSVDFAHWNTPQAWSSIHDHLTLDTTHWGTFNIDPIEPLRMAGERVAHIHLSNYKNKREHRLPQDGELNLGVFLQELVKMDFGGTVSVELHPDALAFENPSATRRKMAETVAFCRQHLQGTIEGTPL